MSEPPSLQSSSDLYSPIDNEKDEIRLITIEPIQLDSLVRCNLHKVSLKDVREEYSNFKRPLDEAGKSARQILIQWARSHRKQDGNGDNNFGRLMFSGPSSSATRFNWGDFAALSYVWGDEQDQRDILLNGTLFSVTSNLETALRALAANNEFQGHYKIWIDAISINQNDAIERANQVNKMREIYSGTWAVVAWLGESDEAGDMKTAFHFLRQLASLGPEDQDLARVMAERQDFFDESSFFALHEMMKRPYWSRLWVVQELVMGASSTILRCGIDWIDWETLCGGITVLYNEYNWNLKDGMLQKESNKRVAGDDAGWFTTSIHLVQQDLRVLGRCEEEGGDRLNFRRLLEIAGSAECRDVRDKVFALTGMMEPSIANEVTKNYNFELAVLFAAVTKAFILHYGNLEPLRQANPWGRQGAPTWAADWTWGGRMRWSRPEAVFSGPLCNALEPDPKPESIYSAHGGIAARYSISDDDFKTLKCDGFLFDEIAGLGAPEYGYFKWSKRRTRMKQCESWRSSYGDGEATASALYKALLGDRILKGRRSEPRHSAVLSLPSTFDAAFFQFKRRGWSWLADQESYYFKWEEWRLANNSFMLGERPLQSYFSDVVPDDTDERTYMEVYSTACRMVMERRFMLTRSGYFGWAPDNAYDGDEANQARVGDRIAIVYGCSTPLVIRPFGNKFQVVGEAYVEGFMDGEAINLLRRGDVQTETFHFF